MTKTTTRVAARLEKALQAVTAQRYVLRLYVSGSTARSRRAVVAIRDLCEGYLAGRYELEVIDLYQDPGRAGAADVVAAPTLVRELPLPVRRLVGEVASRDRILIALDIGTGEEEP